MWPNDAMMAPAPDSSRSPGRTLRVSISLNMHKDKYAIICKLILEYAEICTKYAVPICKKYTQMCKKKMQYMCKISNMHKSAFYMQIVICVLYA